MNGQSKLQIITPEEFFLKYGERNWVEYFKPSDPVFIRQIKPKDFIRPNGQPDWPGIARIERLSWPTAVPVHFLDRLTEDIRPESKERHVLNIFRLECALHFSELGFLHHGYPQPGLYLVNDSPFNAWDWDGGCATFYFLRSEDAVAYVTAWQKLSDESRYGHGKITQITHLWAGPNWKSLS